MMPNMGPEIQSGMGTPLLFWVVLAVLVSLLVIGACIWLAARFLNRQRTASIHNAPQPQDAYHHYEQGYHPEQPAEETYQKEEQSYPYPKPMPPYEQPQAQYSHASGSEH